MYYAFTVLVSAAVIEYIITAHTKTSKSSF